MNPTVREIRDLLAQAIRHHRLMVPDVLREAEHNAAELMRLYALREAFTRRPRDPAPATAHPTPAVSPGGGGGAGRMCVAVATSELDVSLVRNS